MLQTLHFGPVALAWRIDAADPRWRPFQAAYAPWLDGAPGDLVIEAALADDAGGPPPRLPSSLYRARRVDGRDFDLGDGLVRGTLARTDLCRCVIHPVLLDGVGLRVLEQFFYLLFYQTALAAVEAEARAPFLLHGSAVLAPRGVHLFCGPSESGKSTAAGHPCAHTVLTDECTVLAPEPGGLRATGSPVNPFCAARRPGSGPLAGLYLIEKALAHALLPIGRAEAVPRLTAEIMLPLGLLETDLARGMARALDRALLLYAGGRVRRLCLLPDAGFWPLLEPA
ncbi:MAG: hypothetical protein ACYDIE_04475 [Candidatus Krumholzibacteriia bacterium]